MVAGEGVDFADLFAEDGVLTYPFGLPGQPAELNGREAIRAYFKDRSRARDLLVMEGVEAVVRETDDPWPSPESRLRNLDAAPALEMGRWHIGQAREFGTDFDNSEGSGTSSGTRSFGIMVAPTRLS
jgi:hypothetical protein